MDTRSNENSGSKKPVELRCDSQRCWDCSDDVCEERLDEGFLELARNFIFS